MPSSPRPARPTFVRALTLLASAVAGFGLLLLNDASVKAVAPLITPGNLVVDRIGDGVAALTSAAQAVFLDEYTTIASAAPVHTIAMPTAVSGSNRILTNSGTATSEGALTRSTNGQYVMLAGYDAAPGTVGVAGTSTTGVTPVLRIVGRVAADGSVDTSTRLIEYTANNIRGVASVDGTAFWTTGPGNATTGAVRYVLFGNTPPTATTSINALNSRVPAIFNGQLYASSAGAVNSIGSGLPTTPLQALIAQLVGSDIYAYAFFDRDSGVAGIDTAYVAEQAGAATNGLLKYSFNGSAWTARGRIAGVLTGLAGRLNGSDVELYATLNSGAANQIVSVTDTAAFNANLSGSFTTIATAGPNTVFRGLAFAPGDAAPTITTEPASQTISSGSTAWLNVVATGSGNLSYQWYQGASGNTSSPVGTNSSSFTTPALVADTQYWVRVSNAAGQADSATATVTIGFPPPIINVNPQSQSISPGQTANLSVLASGSELGYQWYQGSTSDTTIPVGANLPTFTTPPLTLTTNYWVRVSNSGGFANSSTATITVTVPPCTTAHIPINQVQGSGETTPYANQTVTIRGVVVGDYEGSTATPVFALGGFYLQDELADYDADPATSEAVFVFAPGANNVAAGEVVQVTGTAKEFQGQTEVDNAVIEHCGTTAAVVPVNVTLAVPAAVAGVDYLERFEGMLVRFNQTLYVTEMFQLGRFGQVLMSSGGRLTQPTSIAAPGAPANALQSANDLNKIIVDDEFNNQNPDPIRFGRNGNTLTAGNTLRGGDTLTNGVGVLTYGWAGNSASPNAYRLRPINALGGGAPNFQASNARPTAAPVIGGSLKVVGMNVLNYFLTLDIGTQANCGPIGSKQECRGPENTAERTRQQDKLTAALAKLSAGGVDIIGMSELENTQDGGGVDVNPLATIVAQLNLAVGADTWSYINTGIVGTDTIRVGIIYKTARVTPEGGFLVDTAAVHNRPPIAQAFTETATGERFAVVVNHFKSKGCASGSDPLDTDLGDGQGCFNYTRTQQSQALLSFINTTVVPAAGDPDVLLVGDFNSYAKEDPIRTLELGGFTNLVSRFAGSKAYSYVFDGQWGYLDHALASASLVSQVGGTGDYHINADEPSVLDYNTNFKTAGQVASLYAPDEYRIADHDPVIVGLDLQPVPVGHQDTYNVESGSTLTVAGPQGVLANDTGGPLAIFSNTQPAHGTLTLHADGSFEYTPDPGFFGVDTFSYTVNGATPSYLVQLYSTNVAPLAQIGGFVITGGGYGSAFTPVPGSPGQFYGLTDRGPNADGPGGTKVEPLEPSPGFTPSIGRFTLENGQASLEDVITLRAENGVPYSGRANSEALNPEQITDLNGNLLPTDANGYDPEGLAVLPGGGFAVSDEYGPFITLFDATGQQLPNGRLSPFDGSLPQELRNRVANRGMEGLTITPDGTTLVGIMQSALQNGVTESQAKKATPLRIVTHDLASGQTHEYLYLLDNPAANDTSVSEITALSNTQFLVDERDSDSQPGAYKKLFLIDISGATDVGPDSAGYDGTQGGLLVGGMTIEQLLLNKDTAQSLSTLGANGITPVFKDLYLDLGALVTSVDVQGHFFGYDKIEGVAALNGGATLLITNDSDFGIGGLNSSTLPYELIAKITPAGVQADGEILQIDLVRSTADVTITTADTVLPDTALDSMPPPITSMTSATFDFHGSDAGSGVASFECSLDAGGYADCDSPAAFGSLIDGPHTFSVRAIDHAGNVDDSPASYGWTVDTVPPAFAVPPDQILEATGPGGAVATFTLPTTAFDAVDGSHPVVCSGGLSGATFPIGVTGINCSSSDAAGNSTAHGFTITVRDTTPPTIDPHADVTAIATSASGALVTYTSPATHDLVGGNGVASCSPVSGSLFPIGSTPVVCNASDAAHNAAAPLTFNVIVTSAQSMMSRFVAFSRDLTWLRAGATVTTGDVGANQRRMSGHADVGPDDGGRDDVTVRIGVGATMQAPSRVVGDTVLLMNRSSVFDVVENFLLKKNGVTILGTTTTPMPVPFTTLPAFPTVTPGTQNITVAKNQTLTLGAGRYGVVKVGNGATLVLTGGLYEIRSLDLDQSARVLFRAATELRIKTELGTRAKAKLILDPSVPGLQASQIRIYVAGRDEECSAAEADDDGDNGGPVTVHIGGQSVVQANIYAANGTVWLKSKTQATGAFIGMHVRIGVNATLTLNSAF